MDGSASVISSITASVIFVHFECTNVSISFIYIYIFVFTLQVSDRTVL